MEEKLKEAQDLILKLYRLLGTSADLDYRLWKTVEAYCKDNQLIDKNKN